VCDGFRELPKFEDVLVCVNDLRGLRRRCSLYSVGPSWGSASRLVTTISEAGLGDLVRSRPVSGRATDTDLGPNRGVDVLGVDHGDETLGGSLSKVKMDLEAMEGCSNSNVCGLLD
jgi:hypothetical protein